MNKPIYLASPQMLGNEYKYMEDAMKSNWIAPLGPYVNKCEQMVSDFFGVECAAVSSGTAALHLAMIECGVGPGDTVFCSDMTFAASVNPAIYQGAKPVFIDCDNVSRNMDPVALELAFEKYGTPKVVIVPHLYGCPADRKIFDICAKYKATVVEDAAEVMGAYYKTECNDIYAGTIGRFGVFSFNGNKIVTGSTGGMVLCSRPEEKKRFVHLSTQAKIGDPSIYLHREIGYNYRMSNLAAAILCAQMEDLDRKIQMKHSIYSIYKTNLEGFHGCRMLPVPDDRVSNYWLSCLITDDDSGDLVVDLVDKLEGLNIQTRRVWTPLHIQPVFIGKADFVTANPETPNSVSFFRHALCIPSDTNMTESNQMCVIDAISGVITDFYKEREHRHAGE